MSTTRMSAAGQARKLERNVANLNTSSAAEVGGIWARRESGRSLARRWGLPYLTTRTLIAFAAVGSALLSAGVAATLSLNVVPSGYALDARLQQVVDVSAGSGAWHDGIRSGQEVVTLDFAPTWRLRTADGAHLYETSAESQAARGRSLVPLALVALVFSGVAIVSLLRRRPTLAIAAAAAACACLGSLSVLVAGFGGALAVAVTQAVATTVVARSPHRRWLLGGAAVMLATWLLAQAAEAPWFATADALRTLAASAVLTTAIVRSRHARGLERHARSLAMRHTRLLWVGALATALASVVVALAPVPAAALALAVIASLLAIPRARAAIWQAIDRRALAQARARATLAAVEEERGRLASEIHDGPLQMLAAVIPRIERRAGSHGDAALLRHTADDLRAVSIALRPPVLDDLGLGAAIAFLADQANDQQATTTAHVTDHAGIRRAQRLPSEVELAAYRICQEGVANARSHGGSSIEIRAEIATDRLQLEVIDNGRGFTDEELRAARRHGRLGMHTMHQRALAVDGRLQIRSAPSGTRVRFDWSRR